jgi:hypothetical protein
MSRLNSLNSVLKAGIHLARSAVAQRALLVCRTMVPKTRMVVRRFRRPFQTRSTLLKELHSRDDAYEDRIGELESNRWPGLWRTQTRALLPQSRREAIRDEVSKFHRYSYGSYSPGVEGWSQRWGTMQNRRVLMVCRLDTAGSAFRWAQAVNRHTAWAARLVAFEPHSYGYPTDLLFPCPEYADSDLEQLMKESTVIHVKDEDGIRSGTFRIPSDLLRKSGKPVIYTLFGGDSRTFQDDSLFQEYVRSYDAHIAMTPDLLFDWLDALYIPHAIDTDKYSFCWTPGHRIAHSPTTKSRKGTELLVSAIDKLDDSLGVCLDVLHGLTHEECTTRKQAASLFFDQAGRELVAGQGMGPIIGWYGNSALEAAVFGIPTLAHLSEIALERAAEARGMVMRELSIINVKRTSDDIRDKVAWFYSLDMRKQNDLARETRRWVEVFHSYRATAAELVRLYERLA